MGDRAWCQRVATFCQSHGIVFNDMVSRLVRNRNYQIAKEKFLKGAGWDEVHEFLEWAIADVIPQQKRRTTS
ncbi:MAG TPA: hypothetical protein VMY37_40900 [Thermoguttaceae bacterium]|nr:hypothetical protein [Thermoguttaceae bacterium]